MGDFFILISDFWGSIFNLLNNTVFALMLGKFPETFLQEEKETIGDKMVR